MIAEARSRHYSSRILKNRIRVNLRGGKMLGTLALVALGLLAGTLGGMLGIGGGVVLVPALVLAFGYATHVAVGTSLAVIVPIALVGALTHHAQGALSPHTALIISVGAVAGAVLGAMVSHAIPAGMLVRIFGAMLLVISLRMLVGGA